jgi:hypothetical protein
MGTEDIPELNLQSLRIPFQYRAGKRQFEVTFISSDISKGGAILGYNGTSPLKEHKVLVGVYADRSGWAYNDKGAIIERKFVSRIASENNPPINPDTGLAERGQDYEPPERRYGFVFEKKGTVTPWSSGEVVTVAVDFDAGTVRFLKAGVLLFERNLPQGALGGIMFHVIASSATINVGQAAFAHSQAGYATWE